MGKSVPFNSTLTSSLFLAPIHMHSSKSIFRVDIYADICRCCWLRPQLRLTRLPKETSIFVGILVFFNHQKEGFERDRRAELHSAISGCVIVE